MEDKLKQAIQEWLDIEIEENIKFNEKYPPNPPNKVCYVAHIKGLQIENSFSPKVGEINLLFSTEYEEVYIWTHDEDENSSLLVKTSLSVKELPFWKNIVNVIWLAKQFADAFERISIDQYRYYWIYYFDAKKSFDEQLFYNLSQLEKSTLKCGEYIKATYIGNLAPVIELLIRDDKAYTSLMMLCSSFQQHSICLICELSKYPYYDHLSQEPEIWEHAEIIPKMEVAIVQACRSVESILGEPPNETNRNAVLKHKEKWRQKVGINPEDIFEKANISYWDFYRQLFFSLRNPSAHSYGNINYKLKKEQTVQAQCFAAIIVRDYIDKQMLGLGEAQKKLNFNVELLKRVSENMSTKITKK